MLTGLARKMALAGLSIAVLTVGGFFLHASRVDDLQQVPPPEKFPWALRTAPIVKRDLTAGFPVLATLSSQTEVTITSQLSGVIRQMGPREGQPVEKGRLLVQLDTQELDNQLAALKARHKAAEDKVTLSEKELRRGESLLGDGFATQENVDTLRNARQAAIQLVNQLHGEIEALKTRVTYGTMLSPADGVISARLQEPGDLAAPGQVIYRITAATGATIKITVPQSVIARLHEGSEIRLKYGDLSVSVAVSRVFPSLDALSMGSAEGDLTSIPFGLPSGAHLPGRVILDRWPSVFVVPRNALALAPDGKTGALFKVIAMGEATPSARVEQVGVTIIASGREGVAISGDVAEGERVAIAQENELLRLKDGDPVQPELEQGQ